MPTVFIKVRRVSATLLRYHQVQMPYFRQEVIYIVTVHVMPHILRGGEGSNIPEHGMIKL